MVERERVRIARDIHDENAAGVSCRLDVRGLTVLTSLFAICNLLAMPISIAIVEDDCAKCNLAKPIKQFCLTNDGKYGHLVRQPQTCHNNV